MRPEHLLQEVIQFNAQRMIRLQQEMLIAQLLASPKYADPRHLAHFEAQVYSQHGEDGIISEIFRRIGTTNKLFVEIGAGDGRENNTAYRLSLGWRGWWFEQDPQAIERATKIFAREIGERRLTIVHWTATPEHARSMLVEQCHIPQQIDLLSLDIDQHTSHLWRVVAPFLLARVAVVEYNASIPPRDTWEVVYDSTKVWDGSNCYGAGFRIITEDIGRQCAYQLVGCDLSGTNAFMVRENPKSLVYCGFHFPIYVHDLYEPPRYFLLGDRGHRPQYGRSI